MIRLSIVSDTASVIAFLVQVDGVLENRRGLNAALAARLAAQLRDHFAGKNAEPNKLGGKRTNFWNQISAATEVGDVTESGATVQVAEQRFNIHLFGGTIVPKRAKALTIPLIAEAHGKSVGAYQKDTGRKLFSLPGRTALFEKAGPAANESLVGATKGRVRGSNRSFSVGLASRTGIRAVFALKKSVRIDKDPDALPSDEILLNALQQEADDYISTGLGGIA